MLWGSNIRLTENDLQEILPPESPSSKASSSPEKNVITECTMVCLDLYFRTVSELLLIYF